MLRYPIKFQGRCFIHYGPFPRNNATTDEQGNGTKSKYSPQKDFHMLWRILRAHYSFPCSNSPSNSLVKTSAMHGQKTLKLESSFD